MMDVLIAMSSAAEAHPPTAQRMTAESRSSTLAAVAILRLAAWAAFVSVAVGWTARRNIVFREIAVPLLAYPALTVSTFAFRRRASGEFLSWLMPFVDIGVAFFVLHTGVVLDPAHAAAFAATGLGVYALIVTLAGLSLPVGLAIAQTLLSALAQTALFVAAELGLWPSLVAACALACVAVATSAIPRLTAAKLRQEHNATTALASLARAQEQNERLEHLQREKDSLLEVIVHDMRSPVGAALLSLEYLAVELKRNPAHAPLLEAIDDALGTLNSLSVMIAQILDTAKLESGRITLHPDISELRSIIEETVQMAAARARSRSIAMTFEAREDIQAAIDLRLFPRALEVLVSHSLRHAPEGGRILLAATAGGDEVLVSIHSSAPAIPAAERDRMFDKFPAAGLEARRNSAWGLGLYFCRLVAAVHQGTIAIEDVDGWSNSFVIRLPSPSKRPQAPA
jgi:signal transduction histidine kinase